MTPLRVLAIGAHPDDVEAGCGGTLARYAAAGHAVTILYLTRGERGIPGTPPDDAARIRSAECEAACRILGATARFAGQIDAATECEPLALAMMNEIFLAERPDLVFAHWPVDTHRDHQIASVLATRAVLSLETPVPPYFYEVNRGNQTRCFEPAVLVDITGVRDVKRRAIEAHVSQEGAARIYAVQTEPTERLRGSQLGVEAAEGFMPFAGGHETLPGL